MANAPQDLSEVYLLEKRKGEIEEVNIIPNGKRRCVAAPGPRAAQNTTSFLLVTALFQL
jgi:hypothetical protein